MTFDLREYFKNLMIKRITMKMRKNLYKNLLAMLSLAMMVTLSLPLKAGIFGSMVHETRINRMDEVESLLRAAFNQVNSSLSEISGFTVIQKGEFVSGHGQLSMLSQALEEVELEATNLQKKLGGQAPVSKTFAPYSLEGGTVDQITQAIENLKAARKVLAGQNVNRLSGAAKGVMARDLEDLLKVTTLIKGAIQKLINDIYAQLYPGVRLPAGVINR
jgi:hypothetical protein